MANLMTEGFVPTYEYLCTDQGHRLEVVQKFTDDALTVCPECGGHLRKVIFPVGVVFKGSGFYRNDSRSGGANGSSRATDAAKEGGSKDGAGKDGAGKDGGSADGGSKDSSSTDSGAKDGGSKNGGAKDGGTGSDSGSKGGSPAGPATATPAASSPAKATAPGSSGS